jgi:hypothetical protein
MPHGTDDERGYFSQFTTLRRSGGGQQSATPHGRPTEQVRAGKTRRGIGTELRAVGAPTGAATTDRTLLSPYSSGGVLCSPRCGRSRSAVTPDVPPPAAVAQARPAAPGGAGGPLRPQHCGHPRRPRPRLPPGCHRHYAARGHSDLPAWSDQLGAVIADVADRGADRVKRDPLRPDKAAAVRGAPQPASAGRARRRTTPTVG